MPQHDSEPARAWVESPGMPCASTLGLMTLLFPALSHHLVQVLASLSIISSKHLEPQLPQNSMTYLSFCSGVNWVAYVFVYLHHVVFPFFVEVKGVQKVFIVNGSFHFIEVC